MKQPTPSKLAHLPAGSCAVGDLDSARLRRKHVTSAEARRKRIRYLKKLAALKPRTVGEELLRDSFTRAKGV